MTAATASISQTAPGTAKSAACPLLFVDASRPGRRRWCSMDRCGNLGKLRRYRHGE